jgi:uroporphyrinogen-III synthase
MPFDGLSVLALESRRAAEMEKLIKNQGGRATVALSMREVPIEANSQAFAFAEKLFAGEFDMVILLTGVGARHLNHVLAAKYPEGQFVEALRRVTVVARGPKPVAVCRELEIPVALVAPEPNTWREVLLVIENRPETRIAVQEYGKPNPELLAALTERGGDVLAVPVYQWDLPADTAPLRSAVHQLAAGAFDVVLFTTSVQADHLFRIAEEEHVVSQVREGLDRAIVASIGPTTTEALVGHGIKPEFEPTHPRMGLLVFETAQAIHDLRAKKHQSRL